MRGLPEKLREVDSLYVGQHARMSKLISKYRPEEFSVIANFLEQTTHVPAEEAKKLRKNSDTGSTESGAPLVCFCNNLFVPQDQQAVERLPAVEASVQSPAARFKTVSIGPGWILLTVMPVGKAINAIDAFPDDAQLWRIDWIGGVAY